MLPIVDAAARKQRGAWFTPDPLVAFLCDRVLEPAIAAHPDPARMRVLDPACGDGRVLEAAVARLAPRIGMDAARRCVRGVELDPAIAREAVARVGADAVTCGDARALLPGTEPVDVVLGNPPYLSPLATTTVRRGRSSLGGGPYADVAVEFLALALDLARPDGGRVGLVLPQSVLASRDAGPVRASVPGRAALDVLWWAGRPVFDAAVLTVIAGFVRGHPQGDVERWRGPAFDPASPVAGPQPAEETWGRLVHDLAGVPTVELGAGMPTLGDRADVTAGFRQHFYGLVPFVRDSVSRRGHGRGSGGGRGAPLVTSGAIDPGRCRWGERPVRFAGRMFQAPTVDVGALHDRAPKGLAEWAARHLVPKVLVATQTAVLEAVADDAGRWLPSVPVVAALPKDPGDVWRVASVLTAPPAAAWAAARHAGTGLSRSMRVGVGLVRSLPLPQDERRWASAATLLRDGDVDGCAEAMMGAYRVDDPASLTWWRSHARLS
jgi:hypothetical protein